VIERSELSTQLGDNIVVDIDGALDRARAHVATRTTGSSPAATSPPETAGPTENENPPR
jgi:hypothetical protein